MTARLTSFDPRNLDVVGEVPVTPLEEIPAVVERSRKAFEIWSAIPPSGRKELLKAFKNVVLDRGEEIAQVVASETGKPLADAYAFDVLTSLTIMDHYVRKADRYLKPRRASTWPYVSTKAWTEYHPLGVAGVISPWNYPFFLPMIPLFTALAAGCSVVLKPSEKTPLSGGLIPDLVTAAGLPADLVQVIQGEGDVGAALIEQVDVVAFIGSTAVGRKVAEAAGRRLIPAILELGGKDPLIVLDDADLRQTARAAVWGGMLNAGQTCVSAERVYVVEPVYDRFMSELHRAVDEVTAATGCNRDVGPVIDGGQFEIIESHVSDALKNGARLVKGGQQVAHADGFYYSPTVLENVDHSMAIMREETFGPVLAVMRVPDTEAALRMADDTAYGLHASIWGRDRARMGDLASRIRSGSVALNDVAINFIMPTLPFGGVGQSGQGVAFGAEGIRSYCYAKGVTSSRLPVSTSALLGARLPRKRGLRYWKTLGRLLFRW
jgi:acyl-CoA reductase-like NAD-dependent aldehyde dehydrogenase